MTFVGRPDSAQIGRIVLQADHSARYVVAGLSQLDRLLRTVEECFAPGGAMGPAPEVVIVWESPSLRQEPDTVLAVSHRLTGQARGSEREGISLVLPTNVVFRRGGLARLLASARPESALAIIRNEDLPPAWGGIGQVTVRPPANEPVWLLNSPEDVRLVERQLFRATGKPTDGLVSRTLNRPISQRVSRLLAQTRVTPNHISFVVLGVLTLSTWLLARGTPAGFVIGMLLFHLASVLDGCDGEIARVKFLESRRGALLDTTVDLLGNFLLPLAVAVGLSRQAGLPAELRTNYLIEGVLTAAGIALGILGVARSRAPANRTDFNDFGSTTIGRFGLPRWLMTPLQGIASLLRRDSYVLLFVILAVLRAQEWILHFLAIGIAVHLPVIAWSWWSNTKMAAPLKARNQR